MSQVRRVARCRLKHKQDPESVRCKFCQDKYFCFTNGKLIVNGLNAETRYIFEVPNDEEGQEFLRLCKKFLNKKNWEMKRRPRNNTRKGFHQNSHGDILIQDAEWFALYFNTKNIKHICGEE